jgi:hypothetical protein
MITSRMEQPASVQRHTGTTTVSGLAKAPTNAELGGFLGNFAAKPRVPARFLACREGAKVKVSTQANRCCYSVHSSRRVQPHPSVPEPIKDPSVYKLSRGSAVRSCARLN